MFVDRSRQPDYWYILRMPLEGGLVVAVSSALAVLTDDKLALLGEVVLGHLEIQRCRTLPYTAGDVVVGAVARAEPPAEVAGLADGDTTQMGADA
jgi:hypothetical protein